MFGIKIEEDLYLGLLEKRHANELFELTHGSRSYLREWLPWVDLTKSVGDSEDFIKMTLEQFAGNGGFQLAICYKGKIAGVIGLHNINWSNKSTSIGYWLGEGFQGKGLMVKSCAAVIRYCFEDMNLNRIEIRVATSNKKSKAIPEKLGFQKEGCLRDAEWLYDKFTDHYVFSLLEKDFRM
ncbi:GNAT family N-acetyltransferase [Solibacillus sp. FSL H8-0538]|uniref:GNAT family N-acetyltransferase n=1 Tax=Solibacillus sp. FSL H8-0538 TaxID=2921400 RepID=UPI0030F9EFC6